MLIQSLLIAATLFTVAPAAHASSACEAFRSAKVEPQLSSCEKLVRSGRVPNQAALKYSISYMMSNYHGLRDPKCATEGDAAIRANDLCQNCKNKEWVKQGLNNNCSFVINDLERPWRRKGEAFEGRTTGYFIDLFSSQPSVETFYINGGRGKRFDDVPRERFATSPSNSSTLAGAFMLNSELRNDFFTGHPADYAGVSARHGGIPAIRMIGLNSSNNTTEYDKPLHVSVYKRGQGCAGVSESTLPIMNKIVGHGTSLYMAYAGAKYEQHGASCKNDSSDVGNNYGTGAPPVSTER